MRGDGQSNRYSSLVDRTAKFYCHFRLAHCHTLQGSPSPEVLLASVRQGRRATTLCCLGKSHFEAPACGWCAYGSAGGVSLANRITKHTFVVGALTEFSSHALRASVRPFRRAPQVPCSLMPAWSLLSWRHHVRDMRECSHGSACFVYGQASASTITGGWFHHS